MKIITLLLALTWISMSSFQPAAKAVNGPAITFDNGKDLHDFGQITKGAVAKYTFKFTNTGDAPLVLTNVKPACGCTVPTWSKEPVLPGQSGSIEATFNSGNASGAFMKSITVTTNIPDQTIVLFIKGEIVDPGTDAPVSDPNTSPVRVIGN